MKALKLITALLLSALLLASSVGHIMNPGLSSGLIPDFLPKGPVHLVTAIVEFTLGILVWIPSMRRQALQGIGLLMVFFLPLHVVDLFRDNPVIGSPTTAAIRVLMQFLLIYIAWFAGGKPARKEEAAVSNA